MKHVLKEQEQDKAVDLWFKNNCMGTFNAATGFGKTLAAIKCISKVYNSVPKENLGSFHILIVVPTEIIKKEWIKEFEKWKLSNILECVDIQCALTAYKYKNKKYSIGVFDEVHNYLKGEEFYNIFKNNFFKRMLCLSASIEYKMYDKLYRKLKCPIVYRLDLYEAINLKLISDFTLYTLPIKLTLQERQLYNSLTCEIENIKNDTGNNSWALINKRKQIIYNSANKLKAIKDLSDFFENKYGVFFTQDKENTEKVQNAIGETCLTHHSGISKKDRLEVIRKFSDGRTSINRLSTALTLDEGVSLPRLSFSVIVSGSSKEKQSLQRIGRTLRLEFENKHAVIIRLYCVQTVDENWLKSSLKKIKYIKIHSLNDIK